MTVPLPAAATISSPMPSAPRHGARTMGAEAFTLPELPDDLPDPAFAADAADRNSAADEPDGEGITPPIALLLPEPVPMPGPPATFATDPSVAIGDTLPSEALPDRPTAESPQNPPAPPRAGGSPPPAGPEAAAARSPAMLAAASAAASELQPRATLPAEPTSSPARPTPATLPPPAITPGVAATNPAESGERRPGRDERGAPRPPTPPPGTTDLAPQTAPFRMDFAASAPQGQSPAAVLNGSTAPVSASSPATPDLAADAPSAMPDVVVQLVDGDALDVTIAAASPDSLERLEAAEPELRQELAALGAEVEAIRVELRPEPGPDREPPKGMAEAALGSRTGEGGGRQGDHMIRHHDMSEEARCPAEPRAPRLSTNGQPLGAARPARDGRIDRYA